MELISKYNLSAIIQNQVHYLSSYTYFDKHMDPMVFVQEIPSIIRLRNSSIHNIDCKQDWNILVKPIWVLIRGRLS